MTASETYPTWVKIAPGHYESAEQSGGTPDFIADRDSAGWSVKARISQQWTGGFRTIGEVREYVAGLVGALSTGTASRRDRMGA